MGQLLQLSKTTTPADKAAVIDEFGDACAKVKAFEPTRKRHEQLRDEIASWYADKAADQDFAARGARYDLWVSMRSNQRKVNIAAAFRALGVRKFLKVCTVTLTALKEILSEPDAEALTTESRTGYRRIWTTPSIRPTVEETPAA
jgi:hypothetical protein